MRIGKLILLITFLVIGKMVLPAQGSKGIDFHALRLVEIKHTVHQRGDEYVKTTFVFANHDRSPIEITTFGTGHFRKIAVLGLERACVCVGDRISFSLVPFDLDSAKARLVGLLDSNHFIYRFGKLSEDGLSHFELLDPDSLAVGKAPDVVHEDNIVVIYEKTLYLLAVHGRIKSYDIHNQVDSCKTCKRIGKPI